MTRVERLEAVRDRLATLLQTADEGKAPALVREYRATLAELADLGADVAPAERTGLGDFERRLAQRESGSAGSRRASG